MSRILNDRLKITPTFVGITNNKAEFLDSTMCFVYIVANNWVGGTIVIALHKNCAFMHNEIKEYQIK